MSEKAISLKIYVETTNDTCELAGIHKDVKVLWLKEKIEALVGIPSFLLQLYYLDGCAMLDEQHLSFYHVLPDATLTARVWRTNEKLTKASRDADWEVIHQEIAPKCCCKDDKYNDDKMVACLFTSCFYGHTDIVEKLLACGVSYRKKLPSGGEAVKVAALRGHFKCTELLLSRKIRPHEWHNERIALTNWHTQDRIKTSLDRIENKRQIQNHTHDSRLTKSQLYDSAFSTWYKGKCGQIYLCEILDSSDKKISMPVFWP